MDIYKLGQTAINKLKKTYSLPNKGILGGGALANTMWELISGNKAIINDIDIFIYTPNVKINIISNFNVMLYYSDEYSQLTSKIIKDDKYSIIAVSNDGIFNYINYNSVSDDPINIINSFDINATQVAYDLENDKLYFTEDFKDFLINHQLKVVNGHTPQHTIIRMVKKADELGIGISDLELEILYLLIRNKTEDNIGRSLTDKYKKIFVKYHNTLTKYFNLSRNYEKEEKAKYAYNVDVMLFDLIPKYISDSIFVKSPLISFTLPNLPYNNSKDFLFYIRNIKDDKKLKHYYEKLFYFYKDVNYIRGDIKYFINEEDVELLYNFIKLLPASVIKLQGYDFNTQITYIKKVLKAFENEPEIGIKLIENFDLNVNIDLSEDNKLLYELQLRKEILDVPKNIIELIMKYNGNN